MDKYNRNNEVWKPIVGFSGYEVSNFGRVKSLDRTITRKDGTKQFCKGVIMKQTPDK
uniref:NUMOD4 domain-containing protein n=1 Tax=Aerococcus urinaeequi TaxID=51665 RepID=UPI00352A866B